MYTNWTRIELYGFILLDKMQIIIGFLVENSEESFFHEVSLKSQSTSFGWLFVFSIGKQIY